jgi:hypothetical protein
MHQHAPAAAPHSNTTPHFAQARLRKSDCESVGGGIIGTLSSVIAGKINHAGVTALRR